MFPLRRPARRVLLGRRDGQRNRHPRGHGILERRGSVLRIRPGSRGRTQHAGAVDAPLRRAGQPHQRRNARLHRRAGGGGGARYTVHMYEGANHAFNNDTNASRYDKAASDLAWSRTVAFFTETLKG